VPKSLPTPARARTELDEAIEQVGAGDLSATLGRVAWKLPLATGVETASIRLRDSDGEGRLHLVASVGTPVTERRNQLFYTQSIAQARSMFALKARHSLARTLGFTWLDGAWIKHDGDPLGAITVGSRTERRPAAGQLPLLRETADRLGEKLADVDRSRRKLERITQETIRASLATPIEAPARVAKKLRPRELTILALYSEGLSALEIADLFVISPHTVRTHIKNAYRRLGVHSREEAAHLIRAERLLELV
jgi:DNA-binding CsgD family transcriptional regulator